MVTTTKSVSAAHAQAKTNSCIKKWSLRAFILVVIVVSYSWANTINDRFFVLSPGGLHKTYERTLESVKTIDNGAPGNTTVLIKTLLNNLVEDHPQVVFDTDFEDRSKWVFNNAGGAMGSMFIIHASITEYLIVFGTAIGTEGHTGRHTADDHFFILQGQQTAYEAGELYREVYNVGDVHHMRRGVVKQYAMLPESWAMEYAQGWIPLMLPFGFADTFFSTLDLITLWRTVELTARQMIANLLRGKI